MWVQGSVTDHEPAKFTLSAVCWLGEALRPVGISGLTTKPLGKLGQGLQPSPPPPAAHLLLCLLSSYGTVRKYRRL
jgi:hypothetical protein